MLNNTGGLGSLAEHPGRMTFPTEIAEVCKVHDGMLAAYQIPIIMCLGHLVFGPS